MSEGTLSPHIYPEIVKSVPFTLEIMQTPIVTKRANGKAITLYEYYTNKQYQDKNLLGSIKKYTLGLPGVLLGSLKKKNPIEETTFPLDSVTVYTKRFKDSYRFLPIPRRDMCR
jgi:hypothetical protein